MKRGTGPRCRRHASMWMMPIVWLVVVLQGCGGGGESKPKEPYPNILVITLDTTRADRLGCYDYELPTSPRIDELAERGVLFERAVAQASITPVSHASIFTGLYPYNNGLRCLHGNLAYKKRVGTTTLADVLGDLGFETAGFISALPCGTRFGLNQGFDHFDDPFSTGEVGKGGVSDNGTVNTNDSQRTALATNAKLFEWLDRESSDGEPRDARPLFVWAHYFDPHDVHMLPEKREETTFFKPSEPGKRGQLLAVYDSEVRYMDHHVGELIDTMSALDRPLIICVVSDHGEGLGDHDWWSHGILYREQIRVPLIFAGPGLPEGRRVDSLVRTVDIVPTLLSMIGEDPAEHLGNIDGVDLTSLLRGEADDLGLMAYAESVTWGMGYFNPATGGRNRKNTEMYSVAQGDWKYIHHRNPDGSPGKHELYNIRKDPTEQWNVLQDQLERAESMERWLNERDLFWDPARATRGDGLSAEDRRKLEGIGYVGESPDEDGKEKKGGGN